MDRQTEHDATRLPMARIAAALRKERARLGLSLSELAKRAGVAKSTLSQLESGSGNPSVETLWALSLVLEVPVSRLIDPPRPRSAVLRRGAGAALSSDHARYAATLLAACPPNARRDLYLVAVEPGPARQSQPHAPDTVEHAIVISGRALIGAGNEPFELGTGDYLTYPGDVPHVCQALAPGTGIVMVMEYS